MKAKERWIYFLLIRGPYECEKTATIKIPSKEQEIQVQESVNLVLPYLQKDDFNESFNFSVKLPYIFMTISAIMALQRVSPKSHKLDITSCKFSEMIQQQIRE